MYKESDYLKAIARRMKAQGRPVTAQLFENAAWILENPGISPILESQDASKVTETDAKGSDSLGSPSHEEK